MPPRQRPTIAARIVMIATAIAGVAGGWFLPLWRATLHAPQYPGGLSMHAYGTDVTGDVEEISALNHYVGMRPFDLADFPELALWPYAIGVAIVAIVVGLIVGHRLVRAAAITYLWGLPLGVLAVIQLRLHQYGHDLDPRAALRIDPFTPLVVGPTEVWNFNTWSWPSWGIGSLLVAAAIVTFGPSVSTRVVDRLTGIMDRRRAGSAVVALAMIVGAMTMTGISPAHAHPGPAHPGSDASLQDRLDAARPGDHIMLEPGIHRGPIVIRVPVVLDGRGAATIEGSGHGTVVHVAADHTVVRGVTVRGSGPGPTGNPAGVLVTGDHVTVEQVVVDDAYIGIEVDSADSVRIVDNTIRGRASAVIVDESHAVADTAEEAHGGHAPAAGTRGDGIRLHDAEHVLVRGNDIAATRDGIYVSFGLDTIIDGNRVADSRYAVHTMYARDLTIVENDFRDNLSGLVLMYRGPVLALRNHLETNRSPSTGFGILIKDVDGAQIIENTVVDNRTGIHIDGPVGGETPARLLRNTIAANQVGIAAYPSARAVFSGNSIIDNGVQVMAQGGAIDGIEWSGNGLGNYWSTYRGYESFAAGFGAVAHREGGSVDRLLARQPELTMLATTPAFKLLRSVEERWGRVRPVAIDEIPLTTPVSPAVPSGPDPVAAVPAVIAGVLMALPWVALAARRRVHASATTQGDVHVQPV